MGNVRYFDNSLERLKNETIRETVKLEESVPSDSLGVSYNLFITMDQGFVNLLSPEKIKGGGKYRIYQVSQEKA
jgi:hypothetical protein